MSEVCFECDGEGWIVDDCFEDSCCCADPESEHDLIPCPNCNPKGIDVWPENPTIEATGDQVE